MIPIHTYKKGRTMKTTLKHEEAVIKVERLSSGKNRILVEPLGKELFIPHSNWDTAYPLDLIEKIMEVKGPAWLCDEIMRDESPDYVQKSLKYDLLGYLDEIEFKNKRILDFGCGCGASTVILGRIFPHTEIVGVELDHNLLSIAKQRALYYGFGDRLKLMISQDANNLPKDIGEFDYVVLSAVFEHLLPYERKTLLPKIWDLLKPDGILFINQTPYRYFPVETHTTGGLPIINYLPDKAALLFARTFSKRNLKNQSWESLLRMGIRGGSIREILTILSQCEQKPVLLTPSRSGATDRIDLHYMQLSKTKYVFIKQIYLLFSELVKITTGIILWPYLTLAIEKQRKN